jgi:hypothetical protein
LSYSFSYGTLIDRSHSGLVSGPVAVGLDSEWLAKGALKLRDIEKTQLNYKLMDLASRGENWDGRGSRAANAQSIFEAGAFLESALNETSNLGLNWDAPHIGLDEFGCVVLEWWHHRNKLTLYCMPGQTVEYVCSWGSNIEEHMDSGRIEPGKFGLLWRWLWTEA